MWRFPYWGHAVFATATASLLVGLAATLVESRKSKDSRAEAKSDGREGEIVVHDNRFANPPSIAATPKSDRKVYHVPTRFGLGTMVLFTVFFALLSLCLRLLNASPSASLVILGLFAVIGGSQVVWQDAPRAASAWAGAVSLPLIFTIQLAIQGAWRDLDDGNSNHSPRSAPGLLCWSIDRRHVLADGRVHSSSEPPPCGQPSTQAPSCQRSLEADSRFHKLIGSATLLNTSKNRPYYESAGFLSRMRLVSINSMSQSVDSPCLGDNLSHRTPLGEPFDRRVRRSCFSHCSRHARIRHLQRVNHKCRCCVST